MKPLSTATVAFLAAVAVAFAMPWAPSAPSAQEASGAAARDTTAGARDTIGMARDTTGAQAPFRLEVERSYGRFGVGAGELSGPRGVAVDPRGRVLVADTGNHRVVRFDSTGVALDQFGGFGYDANRFDRPSDVYVGGALSILVLDRGNARIVKYDLEGRPIGVVVDFRSTELRDRLGVVDPTGFAADRGGQLFVADRAADRLLVFDPLGAIVDQRGGFGAQEARFADPSGIGVDDRGRTWVADGGNRRLQLLDGFGGFVRALPLEPAMTARDGLAVAVAPDGGIALADPATGRLTWFDARGFALARHVPAGRRDWQASGVAFDDSGRLHVADARGHRVVRLVLRGTPP